MTVSRPARWLLVGATGLVLAQMVPYGRWHDSPPSRVEPPWDRAETRVLARAACFDCHSNETAWPWYSHVAPISWLVQHDVDEGRAALNFSNWDRPQEEADEASRSASEGEMPPWAYTLTHVEARLDADQRRQLAAGLEATLVERPSPGSVGR